MFVSIKIALLNKITIFEAVMLRLKPSINLTFSAPVWRMVIDEQTDTLFVEIRDASLKQVSFNGLNLRNAEVYLENFMLDERWLTGIEAADRGILLLHGFAAEGPAHKGITAVNATNGEVLWTDYNTTFDHLTINGPVVFDSRITPRKFYLTDIETGSKLGLYNPQTDFPVKSRIAYPEALPAEQVPFDLLAESPYGNIVHYVGYNNFRIVSLHAQKAGGLMQLLYVWDDTMTVYEDILNVKIQKLQPEAFILYKNYLIYLKNQTEVKVINL
jgi:hypothetical protein